jgi:hypothetical protein
MTTLRATRTPRASTPPRANAILLLVALPGIACSDTTAPLVEECDPETVSVAPTVTVGASVVFDWNPACGVALLLVEEGASDRWVINTPESTWYTPSEANAILPPVTYGEAPAGLEEDFPAEPLVAGQTYELVLWRALPPEAGDGAGCITTLVHSEPALPGEPAPPTQTFCLLTVHAFTR